MISVVKVLCLVAIAIAGCFVPAHGQDDPVAVIKPILKKNCFSCHRDSNLKGGVDLQTFFFGVDAHEYRIIKGGKLWMNVVKQIQSGNMPPDSKPPLSVEEREKLVTGINKILFKSLDARNPGRVVIRRMNHKEYEYSIKDLVGIDFDAARHFPSDGSGGAGFDNYSRTLFMTPLRFESYLDAADKILDSAYANHDIWTKLVPTPYEENWWTRFSRWVSNLFGSDDSIYIPTAEAQEVIVPFASRAFRRFLTPDEKQEYLTLFNEFYKLVPASDRFNMAIRETAKAIIVSPNFLYRHEEEQPIDHAYPLGNFEVASRLSFFLWSSGPDAELFDLAYRGDLTDEKTIREQTLRMLRDPRAKRFAESFVTQWFGISTLPDTNPLDVKRYPAFTPGMRKAMYNEMVEYFYHVLSTSKNFLDLIDSDYTFLNEKLAMHYGIEGVKGDSMRKVVLQDRRRGGVISMGSVLATTSLPLRTSPVKRGQFVLEELLGTPAPPPPPNVGELPERAAAEDASLRELLTLHRSNPSCAGCHQKMDPIGFGLENFDPTGKWRDSYGNTPIIAWDTLATGEIFNGPRQLKKILLEKDSLFARVIAEKMFTYALGRNVEFTDELFIRDLVRNLETNNFNTDEFMLALVTSYPFLNAINDPLEKYKTIAKK